MTSQKSSHPNRESVGTSTAPPLSAIKMWNALPQGEINADNTGSFKRIIHDSTLLDE